LAPLAVAPNSDGGLDLQLDELKISTAEATTTPEFLIPILSLAGLLTTFPVDYASCYQATSRRV